MKPQETKSFYTTAEISADGSVDILEIIDTDFTGKSQRGIYRDIPDVQSINSVESPHAPDFWKILNYREISEFGNRCIQDPGVRWTCLRIGEPNIDNYGLHRYIIEYELKPKRLDRTGQCGLSGETICWNAIPERWEWDINSATIQLRYPQLLENPTCGFIGGNSSSNPGCDINQVGDIVIVTADNIADRTGLFIAAQRTNLPVTESTDFLPPPKAPTGNDGRYPLWNNITNVVLAILLAILGKVGVTQFLLYRGRDIVRSGGATEAAFADSNDGPSKALSYADMNKLVTLSVVPPDNVTPYHGAILINEEVTREAKQAWFLQQVVDGTLKLKSKDGSRYQYVSSDPPESQPLREIFGKNAAINQPTLDMKQIGEHTSELRTKTDFAYGWDKLGEELKEWYEHSDLWFHKKAAFGEHLGTGISFLLLLSLSAIVAFFSMPVALLFSFLFGMYIAYIYRGWE